LKFRDIEHTSDKVNEFTQFLPLESMANLIKEPFSRLNAVQSVAKQVGEDFKFDYDVHWYQILIVLIWTFIFIYLTYFILKKRDL
jgi:hypothetical protein